MKPQQSSSGLTVVKRRDHFVNWCAWRYWLHRETGKSFFPDTMTVWSEWPPETQNLANIVCQTISDIRKKIGYDLPVCDPAQPWDRWDYNEREDLARRHREDVHWNPPLPPTRISRPKAGHYETKTQRELREWMNAEADKRPRVKKPKPIAVLPPEPVP